MTRTQQAPSAAPGTDAGATTPGPPAAPGWRMLGGYLVRHRSTATAVAAWSLLEALPALLSGLLVATALDRGFLAGRPAMGLGWLGLLGITMVIRAAVTRTLTLHLGRLVEPLRDELVTTVVAGSIDRAVRGAGGGAGAGVSRMTGQVESARSLVSALLRSARQFGISLAMAFIGLAALSAPVAAIAFPPVLLTLVLCVPRLRKLALRQRTELLAEERLAAAAGETFDGIRDVLACGARDRAAASVTALITEHQMATRATERTSAGNTLLVSVGCQLPMLALLLTAPRLLRSGALTVGELLGAASYLLSGIAPALRSLVAVLGSWGVELDTVLRRLAETATAIGPADRPSGRTPASADLTADRLTYAYGPHAVPVISELSLDVTAGTHLVVVGPSGVGKSTLTLLIAGLAGPGSGRLCIGGVPVHEADTRWLRREVVLIPQEAYVFTGTLRDNLRYLCPAATDDRLTAALAAVGATELAERLGGLDGPVGLNGPELSSGEKQWIALARAYASPASIVVLDEAGCHLDPTAEAKAEEAFVARGTTLVIVAHRISSALRARRILVMDGASTATGTHEELLRSSALYADLVGHWLSGGSAPDAGATESLTVGSRHGREIS